MQISWKNEELKFIIDRYDHYFDSINNKGNLYLTINTFIIGGVVGGFFTLKTQLHYQFDFFQVILFGTVLLSSLLSFFFTLWAIKPYLNRKLKQSKYSLIFFGDVSKCNKSLYDTLWDELSDQKFHNDLRTQSHLLASGLEKKFFRLSIATYTIGFQIFSIIIFGITILIK